MPLRDGLIGQQTRQKSLEDIAVLFGDSEEEMEGSDAVEETHVTAEKLEKDAGYSL